MLICILIGKGAFRSVFLDISSDSRFGWDSFESKLVHTEKLISGRSWLDDFVYLASGLVALLIVPEDVKDLRCLVSFRVAAIVFERGTSRSVDFDLLFKVGRNHRIKACSVDFRRKHGMGMKTFAKCSIPTV